MTAVFTMDFPDTVPALYVLFVLPGCACTGLGGVHPFVALSNNPTTDSFIQSTRFRPEAVVSET
jgi:hypothetical protein